MCSMESAPQDARRTRSKRRSRRPKFLSLRLKLCPAENPPQDPEPQRQADLNLNLFPAPSDNPDAQDDSSVARFLNPEGGASHTLAGLLDDQQQHLVPSATTDPEDSPSPGYSRGWERDGGCEESLVRAAMRRRRNEAAGETERWVSCVDVFERKEEEVSSCSDGVRYHHRHQDPWEQSRCLSLKLDYEEIMTAWSDKGPLYVAGPESAAAAQTVPDIYGDEFLGDGAGEVMDGWGCPGTGMAGNEGVCRVPVTDGTNGRSMTTTSNRMGDSEAAEEDCALMEMGEWKVGQRAASVLRYKEKRQNRLFSKRIRYEVRKLNAEKRPRLKGRFVKRS